MLREFNLSTLHECHCLRLTLPPEELLPGNISAQFIPDASKGHRIYGIESESAFFGFLLYRDPAISPLLPKYDEDLMKVLSRHYIRVYCALWSSPTQSIVDSTTYIISNFLNDSFKYSTVHKRAMEGGCSKVLSSLKNSNFSSKELPMNNEEWFGDLKKRHPLCEMTGSFVADTLRMHERNNNTLFISFDGKGNVSSLKALGAVFSSVLESTTEYTHLERKFVDMHMAIHGDFFLLNPRSTFSWQVFLIRNCLRLESVPILTNTDVFVQDEREYGAMHRDRLWVSFVSVVEAANHLRKSLNFVDH